MTKLGCTNRTMIRRRSMARLDPVAGQAWASQREPLDPRDADGEESFI